MNTNYTKTDNTPKGTIHVVTKYFYPVAAGIETNIMETYRVLAQNGWRVVVHTSRGTLLEKDCLPEYETLRGIEVRRYPFRWYGYFPDITWVSADLVCLHNFNIVPHGYIMFSTLIRRLLGRKGYALMLTPHGGFNPEWSVFPRLQVWIKKIYHYTIGVLLVNLAVDGVRAVSEWEKEAMVEKGIRRSRVVVIDNGLEDEAYMDLEKLASPAVKATVKKLGRYIIQIGRIHKIKNFETVIGALAKVPDDVVFAIVGPVGDEAYKRELERYAEQSGLKERVVFLGVMRGVDKYYLIKHAQMMVHMAIWESYCNVVHEGLSQGLVCIVADVFALPYLVKDKVNGYCLPPRDVSGVAATITYVLEHKSGPEVSAMEKRNKAYGLQNSWREVAGRMDAWYRGTLVQVRPS